MSAYKRPNAFVSIQIAEAAVAPTTPSFYPTMIGSHFFVAYKEAVTDQGKEYYNSLPLESVAYPKLPKQSVATGSYLSVDIGDLAAGANDASGSPNTERFDPDVFIVTDDGNEVDISLAEGLNVTSANFLIPGNITYNKTAGTYKATKGDISDGNMEAVNTSAWATVYTTNAPTLAKDAGNADYANTKALKVTLHGTPATGDGVKSTAFAVVAGETYKAIFRGKKAAASGANYKCEVYNENGSAAISTSAAKTNTAGYETVEISFTVPSGCSSVTLRMWASDGSPAGSSIFYAGSMHIQYTGADALTGSILVSYRAFEEKYTGQRLARLEASTLADLQALFGTAGLGPANPLGYMMYQAWVHSGLTVRGIAVGNPANDDGSTSYTGGITDEVLAYTASLDFMKQSPDDYYGLALGSSNEAVWDIFDAYLDSQAAGKRNWSRLCVAAGIDNKMLFRRGSDASLMGMFSSASVGGFTDKDTITYNGNDYEVRAVDGVAYVALPFSINKNNLAFTYNGANKTDGVFTIADAAGVTQAFTSATAGNFLTAGYKKVKVNDYVDISTESFQVVTVRSDVLVMQHSGGVEIAAGLNKTYTMYRFLTLNGSAVGVPDKTTMAEMARDRAKAYLNERMIIVVPGWVSANINNEWEDVESWYAAAQLAAEMCYPSSPAAERGPGFPVGLGFTGLREAQTKEFRSVRYFNETQLDTIGSGGNVILENANPGESLHTRHSLTTDMTSIETQEIMMGVARDYVAYTFRKTMETLVKRMRVAAPLGVALKMRLEGVKKTLISEDAVVHDISITSIAAGSTPDKVSVSGTMTQIYPLNQLDINIDVIQPQPFTVSL